jgi:hypothetical protein
MSVSSKMMNAKFFDFMEKIFTVNFPNIEIIIVNSTKISCPRGLQCNINHEIGYCQIISLFWLYILLKLMKLYGTDTLYSMTVYFGYKFITKFYSSHFLIKNPKDKQRPDPYVYNYNKNYNSFLFQFSFHYNKVLKDIGDRKTEFFINRRPDKRFERQEDIKTKDTDVFRRKNDGAECKTNNDCASHTCRNNKCEPYNFDEDRHHTSDSDSSHSDIGSDNSTDSDISDGYDDDNYYHIKKLFGKTVLGKTKDRYSKKNK